MRRASRELASTAPPRGTRRRARRFEKRLRRRMYSCTRLRLAKVYIHIRTLSIKDGDAPSTAPGVGDAEIAGWRDAQDDRRRWRAEHQRRRPDQQAVSGIGLSLFQCSVGEEWGDVVVVRRGQWSVSCAAITATARADRIDRSVSGAYEPAAPTRHTCPPLHPSSNPNDIQSQ